MKAPKVKLDARRRSIAVDGRETMLQQKCWQVLALLMARTPNVVSRAELIDTFWGGTPMTGEKGLNQSIWTLRKALGDDTRAPRFIRTVPRQGYQWIHSNAAETLAGVSRARVKYGVAAGISASVAVLLAIAFLRSPAPAAGIPGKTAELVAVTAYVVDRDIHVEFKSGCIGILKSRENAVVRTPVLSADGARVALTLGEGENCRLVTVDLNSRERQEYGFCPSEII